MAIIDPVKAGIAALDRILAGETLVQAESEALAWLDSVISARKSIVEYSPRTRRRYLTAAKKGESARQANAREYARRQRNIPAAQRRNSMRQKEMRRIMERRNKYLPRTVVDWEVVENFIDLFGEEHVLAILKNELDSIEQYVYHHNREPGNRRWHNRVEEVYPEDTNELFGNTDILYFYHGVRI